MSSDRISAGEDDFSRRKAPMATETDIAHQLRELRRDVESLVEVAADLGSRLVNRIDGDLVCPELININD